LPEEFRSLISNLQNNEISEIKKTTFGHSFIVVKNTRKIDIKEFFPEIKQEMSNAVLLKILNDEVEKIRNDIKNNGDISLDEIAKRYKVKLQTFDYFDNDGYYKDNTKKSIADDYLLSRDNFEKIFNSDLKKIGIEQNRSDYIIFMATDSIQPIQRDFDSVKNLISDSMSSEFKEKKISSMINDIESDISQNNLSLLDIEKKYGDLLLIEQDKKIFYPEVVKTNDGSREDVRESEIIFSVKSDKKHIKIGNSIYFFKSEEKNHMNEVEKSQYLEVIEGNMLYVENNEIMESLFRYLRSKYKVKIFDNTLI